MIIEKVIIENYKSFEGRFEVDLSEDINLIVGNNEAGKSSILECINIALTGTISTRYILYELNPFYFNQSAVQKYLASLHNDGAKLPLPEILIEIYCRDDDAYADYKGINN